MLTATLARSGGVLRYGGIPLTLGCSLVCGLQVVATLRTRRSKHPVIDLRFTPRTIGAGTTVTALLALPPGAARELAKALGPLRGLQLHYTVTVTAAPPDPRIAAQSVSATVALTR
jgi:hypothetical protein